MSLLLVAAGSLMAAAIRKPPTDWNRPPGRPNHTWLRATKSDLRPLNMGPSYAWKKQQQRRWSVDFARTLECGHSSLRGKKREMGEA